MTLNFKRLNNYTSKVFEAMDNLIIKIRDGLDSNIR